MEFSVGTGEVRVVVTPEKEILPGSLGLSASPDGKWLLYTQSDQRGSDIVLVETFR